MALRHAPKSGAAQMGELIDSTENLEVDIFNGADQNVPGLDWELSEGTQEAIKAIDENIRAAEQISGKLTVG
jgi:hypothetical protein